MIRLAVLGDPVEHSLSPRLHRAALAALGIEGTYEARRVSLPEMAGVAEEVREGVLNGANITMPLKLVAAQLSDLLVGPAGRIGSVNTWARTDGRLVGHSTDGGGVLFAIRHRGLPEGGPVLVLGAGGAAAAALDALADRRLHVAARRPEAAAALIEQLALRVEIVPWGTAVAGALVINATPVGMRSEPLPAPIVEAAGGLLDMVYGKTMTPAVARAMRNGIPVSDGLPMLVGQALESFRLWTGRDAPADVMLEAANLSSGSAYPPKKHTNDPSGVEPCR